MTTYRVHMIKTLSTTVEVEADSEGAAIQEAFNEAPGGICAQCSGWGRGWSVEDGEWDLPEDHDEVGRSAVERIGGEQS